MLNKTISLVGMMGSGKSAVGAALARLYNVPFVDADAEIVARAGMEISGIFRQKGETFFRGLEVKTIEAALNDVPSVLATGGGAFVQDETRKLMLERSLVVWLKVPIADLVQRLQQEGEVAKRPLLAEAEGDSALAAKLADMLEVREPFYKQAHVVFEGTTDSVTETAQQLKGMIDDFTHC